MVPIIALGTVDTAVNKIDSDFIAVKESEFRQFQSWGKFSL